MRNGDLRLLSAGITRNIHLEAENGALREFIEQLQSRVVELQERAQVAAGGTPTTVTMRDLPRIRPS